MRRKPAVFHNSFFFTKSQKCHGCQRVSGAHSSESQGRQNQAKMALVYTCLWLSVVLLLVWRPYTSEAIKAELVLHHTKIESYLENDANKPWFTQNAARISVYWTFADEVSRCSHEALTGQIDELVSQRVVIYRCIFCVVELPVAFKLHTQRWEQ